MNCPNCGSVLKEDYAFCPNCGYVQQGNGAGQQSSNYSSNYPNTAYQYNSQNTQFYDDYSQPGSQSCMICGCSVADGYKLCPQCSERSRMKNSSFNRNIIILLSIIIAVAVVTLASLIVLKANGVIFTSSDDQTVEETQTNNEPEYEEEKEKPVKNPVKTYSVYKTFYPVTWESARELASEQGGHIAVANSEEEFNRLCAEADKQGLVIFWMGIKRTGEDWNDVYCLDGSEYLPYANWLVTKNGREPSLSYKGVQERYLMALKSGGKWYFNDAPNDISADYPGNNYRNKIAFIIEKEE